MAKEPKPKTLAIVAADAEYPKNASEGARYRQVIGLVSDKSYLEQFRDARTEAIFEPAEFRTGELVEPYSNIKK